MDISPNFIKALNICNYSWEYVIDYVFNKTGSGSENFGELQTGSQSSPDVNSMQLLRCCQNPENFENKVRRTSGEL